MCIVVFFSHYSTILTPVSFRLLLLLLFIVVCWRCELMCLYWCWNCYCTLLPWYHPHTFSNSSFSGRFIGFTLLCRVLSLIRIRNRTFRRILLSSCIAFNCLMPFALLRLIVSSYTLFDHSFWTFHTHTFCLHNYQMCTYICLKNILLSFQWMNSLNS